MVEKWEVERVCFLLVRISDFFAKKGLHLNLMPRNKNISYNIEKRNAKY